MQPLSVIRTAALEAMEDSADENPDALRAFHKIADPRTVLELLELAENAVAGEQMKELAGLIRDMRTYIERVPDPDDAAAPLKRQELLERSERRLRDSGPASGT